MANNRQLHLKDSKNKIIKRVTSRRNVISKLHEQSAEAVARDFVKDLFEAYFAESDIKVTYGLVWNNNEDRFQLTIKPKRYLNSKNPQDTVICSDAYLEFNLTTLEGQLRLVDDINTNADWLADIVMGNKKKINQDDAVSSNVKKKNERVVADIKALNNAILKMPTANLEDCKELAQTAFDEIKSARHIDLQTKYLGLVAFQSILQLPKGNLKDVYLQNFIAATKSDAQVVDVARLYRFAAQYPNCKTASNVMGYAAALSFGMGLMLAGFALAMMVTAMPLTIIFAAVSVGFLGLSSGTSLLKRHSIFAPAIDAENANCSYTKALNHR